MFIIIALNASIFLAISLLHFYWALGRKNPSASVIPIQNNGELLFEPSVFATLMVAFGLLLFALIMLGNFGILDSLIDRKFVQYGNWAIAVIFVLRAMGDFNYVGFSKKVKHTKFATNDTRFYSPLSLLIGIISIFIALNR